jgi:hypothetical protein
MSKKKPRSTEQLERELLATQLAERRIAAVVNQVSEQRKALTEGEDERLHGGSDSQNAEGQHDDPHALAGALDALVHHAMRVTMPMSIMRMPMPMIRRVLVRTDTRVGMTEGTVAVQLAFNKFVGSGGHRSARLDGGNHGERR